jgi:outer membrane protein assembly factor BamB
MKTKRGFYLSLFLLIASFATAQVPCSGTILTNPTLFVNWPQFQYDTAHTGCNPYESVLKTSNVGELKVKWQDSVPLGGYSSGVVTDGFLYTSVGQGPPFFTGSLGAVNTNTGAVIWSIEGQNQNGFTSPAVAKGVVYAGSSDHNIYALDAKTGTVIWNYATGGEVYSAPTIANGIVYAGSTDNNVYALNAATGALLWKYTTGGQVDYWPAVANGIVYAGSLDHKLYALDANTGALIWSYATGSGFFSASVAGGKVYVGSDQVYALNASTGALLWTYPASGSLSPAVARGMVYLTSTDSNVYSLNGTTGALNWKYHIQDSTLFSTSAAVANGVVYANTDHYLNAIDAGTGALLWSYSLAGDAAGWPVVANGVVYMGSSACPNSCSFGYLYAFSLNGQ